MNLKLSQFSKLSDLLEAGPVLCRIPVEVNRIILLRLRAKLTSLLCFRLARTVQWVLFSLKIIRITATQLTLTYLAFHLSLLIHSATQLEGSQLTTLLLHKKLILILESFLIWWTLLLRKFRKVTLMKEFLILLCLTDDLKLPLYHIFFNVISLIYILHINILLY